MLTIEKYSLLKNIRPESTAFSKNKIDVIEGKYRLAEMLLDGKPNDYERFKTETKKDKTKYYISAFEKDNSLFSKL